MPELYYRDALKLGQKEYRARVAAGQYPYLPVMDDIVAQDRVATGVNLGLVSVPANRIVGTKTRGRTNAFAANFMPLLAENSEFGRKWENLCQSHLEEGIRDPIKVYEYMNRYYVEEGNKRVSVLKFFDAVSIPAQVTRVMPEANGTPEYELYREYLDFNRLSGVNWFELSKKGGYARLLQLMGKGADEPWTDEDRSRFSSAYHAFQSTYEAMGGGKLNAPVGDALLAYIKIYGYDALCEADATELKRNMARMWEEVRLQQEAAPIEIKTAPAGEKRESLLSRVLPASRPTKVAFVYDRNPGNSAWAYGHEQGRLHAQEAFNGKIETQACCDAMETDARGVIERAVEDGNRVIFTTSPRLLPASLQAAVDHPDTMIFNCSLNQSHRYIRTYYARIYEAKFIVGAIAGAMAEGDVGYICDYPIYGQIAGINAFALGVQMVNPRARVALEWSSVGGIRSATQRLLDRGVSLISCQDFSRPKDGGVRMNGLMRFDGGEPTLLAQPVWKWDVYYEEMLRRVLDKTLQGEYAASAKALNYYWGMSAGVVDVQWSSQLPEGVQKLAGYLKYGVCRDTCNPFALPVRDQAGNAVDADGPVLGLEQIIAMDWLVQNVSGAIPAYDELEHGRATVNIMGVEPAAQGKE